MNATWFILTITILQLGAVVSYATKRRWVEATLWLAFAVANVCLIMMARQRGQP